MTAIASLSVDLDNKWSYLKTHGDPEWTRFPTILETMVTSVLEFADRHDVRITFFVVGQDAELDSNRDVLAELGRTRHEVANHSFHHEPWLHLKTDDELKAEFHRAETAIGEATGRVTRGFRAPGYSMSQGVVRVLSEMGYDYDASSLPTFIGPLARMFYARSADDLSEEDEEKRRLLFGRFRDGVRSNRPHVWRGHGDGLLEIPVTTFPLFRTPIHTTYLAHLSGVSPKAAEIYLRAALSACRLVGTEPSFLLHGLDFVGGDEVDGLEFFPGMDLRGAQKREMVDTYVSAIAKRHRLVAMDEHAHAARAGAPPSRSSASLPG